MPLYFDGSTQKKVNPPARIQHTSCPGRKVLLTRVQKSTAPDRKTASSSRGSDNNPHHRHSRQFSMCCRGESGFGRENVRKWIAGAAEIMTDTERYFRACEMDRTHGSDCSGTLHVFNFLFQIVINNTCHNSACLSSALFFRKKGSSSVEGARQLSKNQ